MNPLTHLRTYKTRSGRTVRRALPDYAPGEVFTDSKGLSFVVVEAEMLADGWKLTARRDSNRAKTVYMGRHYFSGSSPIMTAIPGLHI